MRLLVFDVGGSHIAGAVAEGNPLRLAQRHSVSVDSHGPKEEFYNAVQELVTHLFAAETVPLAEIDGMSFGFPGPFDYREGISHLEHKFEQLKGQNLRAELARRFSLPGDHIQFVNDADAFLLGELTQIPTRAESRSIGITLGTGVGSAFAIGDRVVHEGAGVPSGGEVWNIPWKDGIVEDAISTRGIRRLYESRTGKDVTVKEIAMQFATDVAAAEVFAEFGRTLGTVLQAVATPFRPNRIIFGGAISRSADLFLPGTEEVLGHAIELRVSTLFEDAALYGAAAHWKQAVAQVSNS